MKHYISPSILSADFVNLEKGIKIINESNADWIHIDVMDGVFVPNITIGFPVIKRIKQVAKKPLDVHLMIVKPERYIDKFKDAGADILSVHVEASKHLHRTIHAIKDAGMKAGVVLNPHTNINVLEDVISDVDLVCIMSVNPGFGGQKFIENTYSKIINLKALISSAKSKALIEVDGGVDNTNAAKLLKCGADVLVAGNYIFSSKDPLKTINKLKK
ncbi:MAG: ribulose-phosphate 3-epimerase [Bacteroidales bacterium]|jgi:ribulose-phosphate 3-epimerase